MFFILFISDPNTVLADAVISGLVLYALFSISWKLDKITKDIDEIKKTLKK